MRKHFNCVWGSVHDMDERTTEDGIWIQPNLLKRKKCCCCIKIGSLIKHTVIHQQSLALVLKSVDLVKKKKIALKRQAGTD